VAPTISCEGGQLPTLARASQNMALAAVLLDMLPPPSADGMDMLYYQLGEILAMFAAQQAECVCWHRAGDSTSSLVHSRAE
jgi:hypothetical protein